MKILIAEDEQDIAFMYKIALEGRGHNVIITHDGEDCLRLYNNVLKRIRRNRKITTTSQLFDIIILDYKMPKKDGIEVAKQIFQWNPDQRIIFVSAFVKETLLDYVKYLKRPVELIQKPFEVDVLVEMIENKGIFDSVKSISNIARRIKDIDNPSDRDMRELLRIFVRAQKSKGLMMTDN